MKHASPIMQHVKYAAMIAFAGVAITFFTHATVEPQMVHSQAASSTFIIQQTIAAESSFFVEPTDVVMSENIAGLTGGQATGTTEFSVLSNNSSGYRVDIDFFDNGTPNAMLGDVTDDQSIFDYAAAGSEPTVGYTSATFAQFAYTVTSDIPGHTDASFFNDGSDCGTGGSQAVTCWMAPSTTPFDIVRKTSPSDTPATSTITFNVTVPSGATPTPAAETYTATATLSLYNL